MQRCGEVTIAYQLVFRNRHVRSVKAGIRARWLERERGLLFRGLSPCRIHAARMR